MSRHATCGKHKAPHAFPGGASSDTSAAPGATTVEPPHKRQKQEDTQDVSAFLRSWAWKREHRPDKERFSRPYKHTLHIRAPTTDSGVHASTGNTDEEASLAAGQPKQHQHQQRRQQQKQLQKQQQPQQQQPKRDGELVVELTIHQAAFKAAGFASTVWDSSIVVAKYIEKHQERFRGRRCIDLSAGCGLVGVVLCKLGASIMATDLEPNLPLLRQNAQSNGVNMEVKEHTWGNDIEALTHPPVDVIFACDVMYVEEAVPDLVKTLQEASMQHTDVYVAHGRNRFAAEAFFRALEGLMTWRKLRSEELDEVYQCSDVDVFLLKKHLSD